jgi:hypothetical protein
LLTSFQCVLTGCCLEIMNLAASQSG